MYPRLAEWPCSWLDSLVGTGYRKVSMNELAVENSRIFAKFHTVVTANSNPTPFTA